MCVCVCVCVCMCVCVNNTITNSIIVNLGHDCKHFAFVFPSC